MGKPPTRVPRSRAGKASVGSGLRRWLRPRRIASALDSKRVLIAVALILTALFLLLYVLFALQDRNPWLQGLLLELGVTFLGILLTVLVVDSLLQRHEEQRWTAVNDIVTFRVGHIAYEVVGSFQEILRIEPPFRSSSSPAQLNEEMIAFSENRLMSSTDALFDVGEANLQVLIQDLRAVHQLAERVVDAYAQRLTPQIQEAVLRLQGELEFFLDNQESISRAVHGPFDLQGPDPRFRGDANPITIRAVHSGGAKNLLRAAVNLLQILQFPETNYWLVNSWASKPWRGFAPLPRRPVDEHQDR
jgi:hypothetical protein